MRKSDFPWNSRLVTPCMVLLCGIVFLPSTSSSQLAKGQSRFVGNIIGPILYSNFETYWNQMTAENAGKWGSVEGSQGNYNWTQLDAIYDYAVNRGFKYKHHTLVWGAQQPSWLGGLDSASQRAAIQRWIDTVAHRYTAVTFVDVVNEPLHAPPDGGSGRANYKQALGGDGETGWDWVVTAFQMARQAFFPTVKLILNDYSIIHDNTVTTNYLKIIDTLRVRGLIDGIGIQGHEFEFKGTGYTNSISTMKSNLERLVATGLPVYVSEFDLTGNGNTGVDDQLQLQDYQTYFPLFWENPGVKGITLWGYAQGNIWRQYAYLLRADATERPALQWLRIYVASPAVVSPVGLTGVPRNPTLVWRSSAPASSYRVQVSADSAFGSLLVNSPVSDTTVTLSPLTANSKFYWRVSAMNANGTSAPSAVASFTTGDQIVAVHYEIPSIPGEFNLHRNYPNPFNPSTTFLYDVPFGSHVKIAVYDVLGRVVAHLVDQFKDPGSHQVVWRPESGLGSGVYLIRLVAQSGEEPGEFTATMRVLFMK